MNFSYHPATLFPAVGEGLVPGPLAVAVTVSLERIPRTKCAVCGHRRVTYRIGVMGVLMSGPLCAICAGIR